MPGTRQRLSVLEGNGRKHLTKAEKAERAAKEINLPKPKTMKVPKWLPEEYRKAFRDLAREILKADMGAATLDSDTIGRYVVAQAGYTDMLPIIQNAMVNGDGEELSEATKIQDRYFKQARACANDLGLTITSRCRLVLPESRKPEENPFEQMMRERMQRA